MRISILYILLIILTCCSPQTNSNSFREIHIERFDLNGNIIGIDTSYLEIRNRQEVTEYFYKSNTQVVSESIFYYIKYTPSSDSIINLLGIICPRIESKTYRINEKDYKVISYYYDIENAVEEESIFYFQENYGILLIYNYGWLKMEGVFNYDDTSALICDSIIRDTDNDFPLFNKRE